MIPELATKRAIEGGWVGKITLEKSWQTVAMDPAFWRGLSKALGWDDKCSDCYLWLGKEDKDKYVHKMCKSGSHLDMHDKYWKNKPWADAAHRFYDLILTGGDTGKFWQELLATAPTE